MAQPAPSQRFETEDCAIEIARLRAGRVLVRLEGRDRGQLGREPFAAIEENFSPGRPLELFIDLQSAVGATLDVSGSWAIWLRANRARLSKVSMLTGSSFILLSAQAVQRFSELGDKAQIYSDRTEFESAYRARAPG
jgi:hypothetical protein